MIFNRIKLYYSLLKMKITFTVVFTSFVGFYIASSVYGEKHPLIFFINLFATGLVCGGACVLNHVIEYKSDQEMKRTKNRPIASGQVSLIEGWLLGLALISGGLFLMISYFPIGLAIGSLLTCVLYLAVYTPLKKVTWLNTSVGAIPGALPVLGGWYAVSGKIEVPSLLLFFILFFWQHPHFYAIAWLCRKDYEEAGYKMITEKDELGKRTFSHSLGHALLLFLFSLILFFDPKLSEKLTVIYLFGAIIIGSWFVIETYMAYKKRTLTSCRRLLTSSIFYLPLFFLVVLLNNIFAHFLPY